MLSQGMFLIAVCIPARSSEVKQLPSALPRQVKYVFRPLHMSPFFIAFDKDCTQSYDLTFKIMSTDNTQGNGRMKLPASLDRFPLHELLLEHCKPSCHQR